MQSIKGSLSYRQVFDSVETMLFYPSLAALVAPQFLWVFHSDQPVDLSTWILQTLHHLIQTTKWLEFHAVTHDLPCLQKSTLLNLMSAPICSLCHFIYSITSADSLLYLGPFHLYNSISNSLLSLVECYLICLNGSVFGRWHLSCLLLPFYNNIYYKDNWQA